MLKSAWVLQSGWDEAVKRAVWSVVKSALARSLNARDILVTLASVHLTHWAVGRYFYCKHCSGSSLAVTHSIFLVSSFNLLYLHSQKYWYIQTDKLGIYGYNFIFSSSCDKRSGAEEAASETRCSLLLKCAVVDFHLHNFIVVVTYLTLRQYSFDITEKHLWFIIFVKCCHTLVLCEPGSKPKRYFFFLFCHKSN